MNEFLCFFLQDSLLSNNASKYWDFKLFFLFKMKYDFKILTCEGGSRLTPAYEIKF